MCCIQGKMDTRSTTYIENVFMFPVYVAKVDEKWGKLK